MKTYTIAIEATCPCCGEDVSFEVSGNMATELVKPDGVTHVSITREAKLAGLKS